MKFSLPQSTKNWMTLIGATISLIALFLIFFLFVVSVIFNQGGSYIGLVMYIILPAFLIVGLILIPVGMLTYNLKIQRLGITKDKKLPVIDFNIVQHRNAFMIFAIGTVLFLFVSAVGSYEAFHYTESVEFCGTICHEVMTPEYTAYQNSPHARVKCVECHVGSGADWYVRSKLSGLRQVYKTVINDIPRPIKTPIKNLRPAKETCRRCHWPEKFYARTLRLNRHYLRNEENSEWDISLIMKVGSEFSALGLSEGIHWHINPNVLIEYAATDYARQEIPWVKYTDLKTGKETVFVSEDNPIEGSELDTLEIRTVDCMDCHNRPSHKYNPPEYFINDAITAGNISKELPEIKNIAFEVCTEEYRTTEEAMKIIEEKIYEFYEENYPEVIEEKTDLLESSIDALQKIFRQNVFPEMNVRWDKYPINIGHTKSMGCFRCHDDNHFSEEGEVISMDCNLCHSIIAQGNPENLQLTTIDSSLTFIHPGDEVDEEDWRDEFCSECHEGDGP